MGHHRNGIRVNPFDEKKNVTNLHSIKIRNIFFGVKKFNREGCRAVRPQNIGLSVFFWQNAQHSGLEGTSMCKLLKLWFHITIKYTYIQLDWTPSINTGKINSRKTVSYGYDNSETTMGKFSANRIQICSVYFCETHFDLIF